MNTDPGIHIMIDIEAMGTRPGAAITSIAAVQFNSWTGEIAAEFQVNISLESNDKNGLNCEGKTVAWWLDQAPVAIAAMLEDPISLPIALHRFGIWLQGHRESADHPEHVYYWAKSPAYDLGLLRAAYAAIDLPAPWLYWQECDVRTLQSSAILLNLDAGHEYPTGVPHIAIDDARHQARVVSSIYAALRRANHG